MNTLTYIDDDGTEYEVTFEYDPFVYGEEDPSLSAWKYILIEEIENENGELVAFDEDKLDDIKMYLWREYKGEF